MAFTRKMTYKELVEDINRDMKALEQIEKPIVLYKEEKQEV
jgi:acyl-CoA synthetase (NDP forming)